MTIIFAASRIGLALAFAAVFSVGLLLGSYLGAYFLLRSLS